MPERALQVIESPQVTEYIPAVAVTIEQARDNFKKLHQVTRELMQKGMDYDTIPGTPKPTLLKPGAEHLLQFFGLGHKVQRVEAREDWENGFFHYCYRVTVFKARPMPDGSVYEQVIAECEGSANSKEARYRYRWVKANEIPKHIDPKTLVYRETKNGQKQYRIENDDPFTLVNTLQKMAIKRALVGATLQATGTSGIFTQDLEDYEDIPQPAQVRNASKKDQPKVATEAQRKRLFAMSKEAGLNLEDLRLLVQQQTGKTSSKDLTMDEIQKCFDAVEELITAKKAAEEQVNAEDAPFDEGLAPDEALA